MPRIPVLLLLSAVLLQGGCGSSESSTDRTRVRVGDALEIAARERGPFDVVFNDVDKDAYPRAFEVARPLVRQGGLFVSHNMLWQGKVLGDGAAAA